MYTKREYVPCTQASQVSQQLAKLKAVATWTLRDDDPQARLVNGYLKGQTREMLFDHSDVLSDDP
jgi:hypothetical protein